VLDVLPEAGDILLQLAIDHVGAVDAEIAIGVRMLRVGRFGQHVIWIQLSRHERADRQKTILVLVAEDEFARVHTAPFDALDLRLRCPVKEAEWLLAMRWPAAFLRKLAVLNHTALRKREAGAQFVAHVIEAGLRFSMQHQHDMNRVAVRGIADFPVGR
jgi:hypothetical protein